MRLHHVLPVLVLLAPLPAQEPAAPDPDETLLVTGTGGERANAEQPNLSSVAQKVVERTNAFRQKQERDSIEADDSLTKAAQEFARYMAKTGRYGHRADERSPVERIAAAGYEYCIVRENIAYAFRSDGFSTDALVDRFVVGWQKSPGHRQNMLARYITETGVAVAKSETTDTYFAVQIFGRPKSQAVALSIANRSGLTVAYRIGERNFSLAPRAIRSHQECQPTTVRFLPPASETETADPPTAIEQIDVTGGERLTVEPDKQSYRVVVSKADDS